MNSGKIERKYPSPIFDNLRRHVPEFFLLPLILAGVFFVYCGSLVHPFINYDDYDYVLANQNIRSLSLSSLAAIFSEPVLQTYVPLTVLTYALDYHFWRLNPWGYHLTNVLLHVANSGLVYILILTLTRRRSLAVAVTLLFGIHPVQIESVVWISERKNLLSGFFFLTSFLSYVAFHRKADHRKPFFLLCSLLFVTACLSKPIVVVLPILFLTWDLCEERFGKKDLLRYFPLFAMGFLCTLTTIWMTYTADPWVYHDRSWSATLRVMLVVAMKYIELLLFPLRQSLIYQFPEYSSLWDLPVALSLLGLLLLAGGLVYLWRRDRRLFFWGAWFVILLLPVSNVIPFPSLMNDRYLYLPLIGFFTLLLLILQKVSRPLFLLSPLIFVSVFIPLNLRRQAVWSNVEALWLDTQAKVGILDPNPFMNLGYFYLQQGSLDQAIEQFQKALAIKNDGRTLSFLGNTYAKRGEFEKAEEHLLKAIETDPSNADFQNDLAVFHIDERRLDLAEEEFQRAISLDPNHTDAHKNLALLLAKTGQEEEAEKYFLTALKINPTSPTALYNLGLFHYERGEFEEAETHWYRLIKIHPDDQRSLLAATQWKNR